jgi:hypothetical protein
MGIALWAQPFGGKLNPNLQWGLLSQSAFARLMRGGAALCAVKIRGDWQSRNQNFHPLAQLEGMRYLL